MGFAMGALSCRGPGVLDGTSLDRTKKTIVMCHHGGRSAQVATFLSTQASFSEVC
jgi:rhodanese-related sulfurtransferase